MGFGAATRLFETFGTFLPGCGRAIGSGPLRCGRRTGPHRPGQSGGGI